MIYDRWKISVTFLTLLSPLFRQYKNHFHVTLVIRVTMSYVSIRDNRVTVFSSNLMKHMEVKVFRYSIKQFLCPPENWLAHRFRFS